MPSNNHSAQVRRAEILLVDDDEGDVLLTQKTFQRVKLYNHLHVVRNGVEALALLHRQGKYSSAQRPDINLMDMHMPEKDGMQTLKEIKADSDLVSIPVFILTSSLLDIENIKKHGLPAPNFVEKPIDLDKVSKIVNSLEDFGLGIVRVSDS
jgi:two-component system response regulator